jgi:hypothetical protein
MTLVAPSPAIYQTANRTPVGFGEDSQHLNSELRETLKHVSNTFHFRTEDVGSEAWQQLNEIASLPEDWDGEDGLPISERTLHVAQRLLRILLQEVHFRRIPWINPDISPTPTGGVYFHWDRPALKLSVLVPPESDQTILLLSHGVARSQRYEMSSGEIAYTIAEIIEYFSV